MPAFARTCRCLTSPSMPSLTLQMSGLAVDVFAETRRCLTLPWSWGTRVRRGCPTHRRSAEEKPSRRALAESGRMVARSRRAGGGCSAVAGGNRRQLPDGSPDVAYRFCRVWSCVFLSLLMFVVGGAGGGGDVFCVRLSCKTRTGSYGE